MDTGTPAHYLKVQLDLIDGSRSAQLQGVDAEAHVDVAAAVCRSVVGPGAIVEPNPAVCHSVVMPVACIAEGATVTRAVVGPGEVVLGRGGWARVDRV